MRREEPDEGASSPLFDDRGGFRRAPWPQLDIRHPPPEGRSGELDPQAFFVEWQLPDAVASR